MLLVGQFFEGLSRLNFELLHAVLNRLHLGVNPVDVIFARVGKHGLYLSHFILLFAQEVVLLILLAAQSHVILAFLFLALPDQLVKVLLQAEKRPVPVTHLYSLVFLKHFQLLNPCFFVEAVWIGS